LLLQDLPHAYDINAVITNCAQNGEVFNPYSLSLATRKFDLKNVIRRLLRLNGVRYDACQPHPLSEIPLRSPCIGRFQTHIQTSACKY
jgi:hypothetical protein